MRTRLAPLALAAFVTLRAQTAWADPPVNEDIAELSAQLQAAPNDVNLLLQRADLYRRQDAHREALVDLRVALALAPSDARIPLQRASVLFDMHRNAAALAEIEALLARDPQTTNAEAHALHAHILKALGRTADAVSAIERAIALRNDVNDHVERGQWLARLGRNDEALLHYGEGLIALSGPASLRHDAVELALRTHHPEQAVQWTSEVIETAPGPARWLLMRARAYEQLHRNQDALADRSRALADIDARSERRPSVALLVERGEALLALGRVSEARRAADTAIARDPRYRPARTLRAATQRRAQTRVGGAR